CAIRGYKVLMVDCDPQGSLTNSWFANPEEFSSINIAHVLVGEQDANTGKNKFLKLSEVIVETRIEGLDIACANRYLDSMEKAGLDKMGRLKQEIERDAAGYDLVFIDCRPHLGNVLSSSLL